jgi:hypothetical protein
MQKERKKKQYNSLKINLESASSEEGIRVIQGFITFGLLEGSLGMFCRLLSELRQRKCLGQNVHLSLYLTWYV